MPNIIRIKRKQRGMSQAQLAKEIGCTQGQISHIERDMNGASPDLAKAISTFLGIPLDAIVQADKSETPPIVTLSDTTGQCANCVNHYVMWFQPHVAKDSRYGSAA